MKTSTTKEPSVPTQDQSNGGGSFVIGTVFITTIAVILFNIIAAILVTTGTTGRGIFWWNFGACGFVPLVMCLLHAKEMIRSIRSSINTISLSAEEMKLGKKAFNITWRILFVFNGFAAVDVFLMNQHPPSIFLWNFGGLIVFLVALLMLAWDPKPLIGLKKLLFTVYQRLFTVHHDHGP